MLLRTIQGLLVAIALSASMHLTIVRNNKLRNRLLKLQMIAMACFAFTCLC